MNERAHGVAQGVECGAVSLLKAFRCHGLQPMANHGTAELTLLAGDGPCVFTYVISAFPSACA